MKKGVSVKTRKQQKAAFNAKKAHVNAGYAQKKKVLTDQLVEGKEKVAEQYKDVSKKGRVKVKDLVAARRTGWKAAKTELRKRQSARKSS